MATVKLEMSSIQRYNTEREGRRLATELAVWSDSHYVAQAGLELLGSKDPLTSVFGVAGTIDTYHLVYMFKQVLQGI